MLEVLAENGITYYIGKNSQDNWDLLSRVKTQNGNWLWFHLDGLSSAYVVACVTREFATKQVINHGGFLCKEHGKYKNLANIGVIYTEVKNVRRGVIVGQAITTKTTRFVI